MQTKRQPFVQFGFTLTMSTQLGHPCVGGRTSAYQRRLEIEQARRAMHWLRIHGLAV